MGRTLAALLLLALLVRGCVLLFTPGALTADTDDYRRLAENLVEHGTFGTGTTPTAYRPPLYPVLLTGCVALGNHCRLGIGLLHLMLGVATVGLVFVLGNWWGLGRRGAALAAILIACDPILLFQSTQIMTETAAAFLAVLGLIALTWVGRRAAENSPLPLGEGPGVRAVLPAFLAGSVLAAGALCRPALLLWAVAAGVVLVMQVWSSRRRLQSPTELSNDSATGVASYKLPAAFALGAVVVLSPWMIRNQLQFGRPIATTTHGGYTLLLANNPEFYRWLRAGHWGDVWRADEFNTDWEQRRPRNELAADRLAYDEAWQTIRSEPGTFAYSCLVRLGRFWSPLPHRVEASESTARRLGRYAVAVWYVLEFLLAAVGLWRISPLPLGEGPGVRADASPYTGSAPLGTSAGAKRPLLSAGWLWGLLLVACLMAAHTVFWTDMRMRAVVMPVVALAAAAGLRRK